MYYVLRVYDKNHHWDETIAKPIQIVANLENADPLASIPSDASQNKLTSSSSDGRHEAPLQARPNHLAQHQLAVQNIVINGSTIQIKGHSILDALSYDIKWSVIRFLKIESDYIKESTQLN